MVPSGTREPSTYAVPWNTDGGAGCLKGPAKSVPANDWRLPRASSLSDGPGTAAELEAVKSNSWVWPCCQIDVSFAGRSPILKDIAFPAKGTSKGWDTVSVYMPSKGAAAAGGSSAVGVGAGIAVGVGASPGADVAGGDRVVSGAGVASGDWAWALGSVAAGEDAA